MPLKIEEMTFYVARHGLATRSTTGYGDRILTAELLPEARTTVQAAAQTLRDVAIDVAYVSPLTRCQQTAAILAETTAWQFQTDDRLREFYQETAEELERRVQSWLQEVQAQGHSQVAVCTHGTVMAAIKHVVLHGTFSDQAILDYPAPAGVVKIGQGTIELLFAGEPGIDSYLQLE